MSPRMLPRISRLRFLLFPGLLLGVCLYGTRILSYGDQQIEENQETIYPREITALKQPHDIVQRAKDSNSSEPGLGHSSLATDSSTENTETDERSPSRHPACSKVWDNPYSGEEGWTILYRELKRYEMFHRKQINCLKHGLFHEDRLMCKTPVRTLTWSCNEAQQCSGIGDQMAQIQMTLLLAMSTNRVFFIYWNPEETSHTMQHLRPHSIDWRSPDLMSHSNTSLTTMAISGGKQSFKTKQYTILLSQLRQTVKHITVSHQFRAPFRTAYRDAGRRIRQAFRSLGVPMILNRGNTALPYLQGTILRYLFAFDSGMMEAVEMHKRRLSLFPGPYATLHLRTGFVGGVSEERGKFNWRKIWKDKQQWTDMIECALNNTNRLLGSSAPLYLATDSYTTKQWAKESYGGRVKTADITLEHVALKQSWQGGEESRATWIDFLLLAHSQLLAHGLSGFSTIAGSFCSLPVSRQVCLPLHPLKETKID